MCSQTYRSCGLLAKTFEDRRAVSMRGPAGLNHLYLSTFSIFSYPLLTTSLDVAEVPQHPKPLASEPFDRFTRSCAALIPPFLHAFNPPATLLHAHQDMVPPQLNFLPSELMVLFVRVQCGSPTLRVPSLLRPPRV